MSGYVELHCHSNYSFLDGASHPEELVERAAQLEMPALALTDWAGLYGVVKFYHAALKAGIKPIIGAELPLEIDGQAEHIVLIAQDQGGYTNLCRLISQSHRDRPKGQPLCHMEHLVKHSSGLLCIAAGPASQISKDLLERRFDLAARRLTGLTQIFDRTSLFLELSFHANPEDPWLAEETARLASAHGLESLASNDVHYHIRQRRLLHDILAAIRQRSSLAEIAARLEPNAEYHLKDHRAMLAGLPGFGKAIGLSAELAQQCNVSLDLRDSRLPEFPVPEGLTATEYLGRLCRQGLVSLYPDQGPQVIERLERELRVINRTGLAEFFLINWDLIQFCRERGIPAQGRGSAADSIVAYLLGITRVDPIAHNLLFERFLHEGMTTAPDIDIDFCRIRREEVIQYLYAKYGWENSGMVCNVVTFQSRLAIRQVGKALGFPGELLDRVAKSHDLWLKAYGDNRATADPDSRWGSLPWRHLFELCQELIDFPRHLSIHVGGMLITGRPLIDVAPVEPAAMAGRRVVQFNKDDVEDLGLIKMDVLGLATLSVVAETLDLIELQGRPRPELDRLPLDDPAVYDLCCRADTVGVFQIESRAQMQTLPRTRPERFNDLIVEVAIIRPGPIQGDAVHPYLRRRQGKEAISYLHPLLEPILEETLGVILYQEQILRIAMEVAGFTPIDADRFRRIMSRHCSRLETERLRSDFVSGCICRGMAQESADELFIKVAAFAGFGFTKSHAAAFARTAYETAWLKLNHIECFLAALLNNQPVGFYSPAVIAEDARRHGIAILPVDVNKSRQRCLPAGRTAIRLGFNQVDHLGKAPADLIVAERRQKTYSGFADFLARTRDHASSGPRLSTTAISNLILVGAFDRLEGRRRELLWDFLAHNRKPSTASRSAAQTQLPMSSKSPRLAEFTPMELTGLDYRICGLTVGPHPLSHLREGLMEKGIITSSELLGRLAGSRVKVAGMVITRQAPHSAHGIRFFTLEDEYGQINLVVRRSIHARYRRICDFSALLAVEGILQRQDGVHSLLAESIEALDGLPTQGLSLAHHYH